ncbi:MAG: phosphodiester glycosidase family protein [Candidatus Margulisiibacteriota bacterium]
MKKLLILILLSAYCLVLSKDAQAGKLYRIRFGYYPEKIRVVFDFDAAFTYQLEEAKEKIIIHLPKTEASSNIENYIEISDMIVRYLEVEKEGDGLKVTIPLREPIPYNIFYLNDPPRLVVDFDREYTNVISGGTIINGVENFSVVKNTKSGRINAQVLKVDLSKAELAPVLARKKKLGLFESFINTLNPWKTKEAEKHFYRARLSDIAEEQGAIAAVNGTYFAYTGKPLGTLLIDREIVATPIYDRTAFIISEEQQAFIDNILIDCYFLTPNGVRYTITGVNQGRGKEAVIMYTPVWGEKTETNNEGIEIVVVNSLVKEIKLGNSTIPKDGYVISFSGPASQFVAENVKVGDRIDPHIKIYPYATTPKGILHLISGGPRLVKNGIAYVSKYEEKFKPDIAQGRAARTAVGITKDGKVLLVTVDGLPRDKKARSEISSIGMTLEELSELMISLGAVEAMNLDGGSSTTMWIDGRVVNQPVNGYQQQISNALVIRPRP